MSYNNLSKLFQYVNDNGDSVIFDYAGGYLINKPSGIDTLSVDLSEAQGINQIGSTIQSTSIQSRPVKVSGYLVGDDQSAKKEKLLSVIRPDIGGKFYADDYYLEVWPSATPTIESAEKFAKFQFSLLAAYPYWCKGSASASVLSGISNLFKFPWNISREYQFGELMATQFVNVPNRGQVPAPYTVTFTAAAEVENPQILNTSTGELLLINKTLESGERLVVENTHERTYVTSSVDGDCRGALSLSSTLFRLAVGDNVLKPTAASGLDDLSVEISFAIEMVGVTL